MFQHKRTRPFSLPFRFFFFIFIGLSLGIEPSEKDFGKLIKRVAQIVGQDKNMTDTSSAIRSVLGQDTQEVPKSHWKRDGRYCGDQPFEVPQCSWNSRPPKEMCTRKFHEERNFCMILIYCDDPVGSGHCWAINQAFPKHHGGKFEYVLHGSYRSGPQRSDGYDVKGVEASEDAYRMFGSISGPKPYTYWIVSVYPLYDEK